MVPADENSLKDSDLANGVPSLPGFENLRYPSAELNTLDLENLPPLNTGITILQRNQHLRVYIPNSGAALFDFDGTIRRTEDICHTPIGGCYELGVKALMLEMGLPYQSSDWEVHALWRCLSTGLERDCERLAGRLSAIWGMHVSGGTLTERVAEMQRLHGEALLMKSPMIEDADTIVYSNFERGLTNVVVSASPQPFVETGVRVSKLDHCFVAVYGGRTKKIDEMRFSPEAVEYVCKKLNIHPSQCAMIGDSISDVSTAMLAGVPMIIVLLEGEDRDRKIQKLLDGVHNTLSTHVGEDQVPRQLNSTIVVLERFRQVDFYPSSVISRPASIILSNQMHRSIEARSHGRLIDINDLDGGSPALTL